jgi:hypothetical protein
MSRPMNKLLVLGTGESLSKYIKKIKQDNIDILAWGAAGEYAIKNKVHPDLYSYVDPSSAPSTLKIIKDSNIVIIDPIVNKSLPIFQKYLRSTRLNNGQKFKQYITTLKKASTVNKTTHIKFTTIKKLKTDKHDLSKYDLDNKDAHLRFEQDVMIAGMSNRLGYPKDDRTRLMNLYENKLTMFILPLCYKLGYKEIYLLGFDGKGGRFYNKNLKHPDSILKTTYKAFLPRWVTSWKEFHNMSIYSVVPDNMSILNNWIPYINIEEI